MIRWKTLGWWTGVVLTFSFLLLVGRRWIAPTSRQSVKLPDGRDITLLGVTYGTHHRYRQGRPLVKVVAPFLSAQRQSKYGMRTVTCNSATPTIMFWVRWPDSRGTNQSPSTAAVFDEKGNESEPAWLSQSAYLPSGEQLIGWAFGNYPRSAKEVGLRIFRYDSVPQPRVIAEFRVRNPGPRGHPAWPAPPFPITRHSGELACTLVNLTAAKATRSRLDMYSPYRANGNIALFQFTQQGTPTFAWKVAGMRAVDATGNLCDTRKISCATLGEYVILEFDGALWPGEQVWKLNVELSRAANFDSTELCTVKAVPAPAAMGTPSRTNLQTTVHGLSLLGLRFEQAYPIGPFPVGAFQRNAVVNLETAQAVEGIRVTLVRAADDRGRTVLHQPTLSSTNTVHGFELHLPPGATNADFIFAIHPSRFVEFLAKPVALTNGFPRLDRQPRLGGK